MAYDVDLHARPWLSPPGRANLQQFRNGLVNFKWTGGFRTSHLVPQLNPTPFRSPMVVEQDEQPRVENDAFHDGETERNRMLSE